MSDHPLLRRLPDSVDCSNDELLDRFLDYVMERKLELYPAQEEAILELFEGRNVILNTPQRFIKPRSRSVGKRI
jgi:ATP-dependent helicase YprA (DUF1998 family)